MGLPIVALFIHPKRAQFIAAKQKQGVRIAPLVNGNQLDVKFINTQSVLQHNKWGLVY